MRLLHSKTFDFREFEWGSPDFPRYAILSHTWESEELTFQDMEEFQLKKSKRVQKMRGFTKIVACCAQAESDENQYVWIDTCCINKESSAELSEAINSMYRWYQGATICYAYLFDVTSSAALYDYKLIRRIRWFTRGWTLQELIAPSDVHFFGSEWSSLGQGAYLGSRRTLTPILAQVTGIHIEVFAGADIKAYSIAQRMSWASKRQTKRIEDIAYSLMGIFEVSMPMLYGEGKNAFIRLQEEIMKTSDDQSLFAWVDHEHQSSGLLAQSPECFAESRDVTPTTRFRTSKNEDIVNDYSYTLTNRGVHIELPFKLVTELNLPAYGLSVQSSTRHLVALRCQKGWKNHLVGIYLLCLHTDSGEHIFRDQPDKLQEVALKTLGEYNGRHVYVIPTTEALRAISLVEKADGAGEEARFPWYTNAKQSASRAEVEAKHIVRIIREDEDRNLFDYKDGALDMGGPFLTNRYRIDHKSYLYRIAQRMPKGAQLRLYLHGMISTHELLEKAKDIQNMYIRSTQPLLTWEDCQDAEIFFKVMPYNTPTADIFSREYNSRSESAETSSWMDWASFRSSFGAAFEREIHCSAEQWVLTKSMLNEDDAYAGNQTINGIRTRFNQATRLHKELLGYRSVFRWCIPALVGSLIRDGIMYAELRVLQMFVSSDDGVEVLTYQEQIRIVLEQVQQKMDELRCVGRLDKLPFGLKIIYCASRSISRASMQRELESCAKLKLEFPDLICGFDLVVTEDSPNHIGFYQDELLAFSKSMIERNIELPFMCQAGETRLGTGGSNFAEILDLHAAVVFNAKRVGHGYSLTTHRKLGETFRMQQICIELCPISNEVLQLCRNIKEHPYPQLLAMGIPCTLNADSPSMYRSSLSFEFYQVMVGSKDMNLHGWRQFAEWSLEHSCLSNSEKSTAQNIFKREWEEFCEWVIQKYGMHAAGLRTWDSAVTFSKLCE